MLATTPLLRPLHLAVLLTLTVGSGAAPAAPAARDLPDPTILDAGPIRVRDQFPLSMGFLAFDPVAATALDDGKWQFDVMTTVTNTFALSDALEEALDERPRRLPLDGDLLERFDREDPGPGVLVVDSELVRTAVALRRGVGRRVQLEILVPVLHFTGGILDGPIEAFHDTFGFSEAGRGGAPRSSFLVDVRTPRQSLRQESHPGTVLGDVALGTKLELIDARPDQPFRLALDLLVELPTGSERHLASNDRVDVGVQLVASYHFGRSCLHAAAGLLALGEWERLGIDDQLVPSGMLAYERAVGGRTSAVLQFTASHTPFDDLGLAELSETSLQLTAGIKHAIAGGSVLFLALTENVLNFDNTQDVGLHVGLTRSW